MPARGARGARGGRREAADRGLVARAPRVVGEARRVGAAGVLQHAQHEPVEPAPAERWDRVLDRLPREVVAEGHGVAVQHEDAGVDAGVDRPGLRAQGAR